MKTSMSISMLVFGLIASTSAFAAQKPLAVTASGDAKKVSILFQTVEDQSSMCFLKPTSLTMAPGNDDPAAMWQQEIRVSAAREPFGICMTAFGPDRGGIELERGSDLPKLADGHYKLVINEVDYGTLHVTAQGVKLDP